ncbi:hypothetical protein HY251_14795 [bacterium]|nr:hypothetical protein [bacterium]
MDRYGPGRAVVREIYAAEADALKPGDLPRACVVAAGYYKDTKTGMKYDLDANGRGQGSIGGCPVERTDGNASKYPISYAARIARVVDGVRRASGSDRVDLALHSMGNVVGRAYTRWLSQGAADGKSKVRRLFQVVGPNRGIDALEATIDGLERDGVEDFMKQGEIAEMCIEYKAWKGASYMERLNDHWDEFCTAADVRYAGLSATGAFGNQVDPDAASQKPGPSILGIHLGGPLEHIVNGIMHLNSKTAPEVAGFINVFAPRAFDEIQEALSASDGTVRLSSSRLDTTPFLQAEAWMTFEGRHGSNWNPEQGAHSSTFCAELAREFLQDGLSPGAKIDFMDVKVVTAEGKASWIALETSVSGAPLVSGQLVEETLDAHGKPTGPAMSFGFPVPLGDQRVLFQPGKGGGIRRYRLMLYGLHGPAGLKDGVIFQLQDGASESQPRTALDATSQPGSRGAVVHATATADVPADEPTLGFSFRLDGGDWTPWDGKATFDTPPLAPGEHRLEARAAHAKNANGVLVNDPKGAALGLLVDEQGGVTVRH